ncbi:uncharacterized protein LOC132200104 [Neocloeon triangulifer]|uniref:uncharacterized protein LOC132200104 n=1 Tax=Neocloeon triangulifer TaxID=2078957 RepID=UPI00286FABAA|nr:uncharacterized protein LOC132200104 [Neocloeon triangulifer]
MEEIQQELVKKLEELDNYVREHVEVLLDLTTKADAEEKVASSIKSAEERSVTEKLGVLTLLPGWLETLQKSLQEFAAVAKSIQPQPADPERKLTATGLFPDPEQYQRRLTEFRELQSEKQKFRSTVALLESRTTVENLADSASAIGQSDRVGSKEETKKECCFLLMRGFPIEGIVERLEDLLDEKWTKAVSPKKLKREAERQLALNETEIEEYVTRRNSSRSLGHVVHRLLASKYPRPPVPPGERLPRLKVMALLMGLDNQDSILHLAKVVSDAKVIVVQLQDALESCIEAYRTEGPGIPLLESREPPTNTPEPEQVTPTACLIPHALLEELKAMEPPPKQKEVETQTGPEVIPCLSMAASLGKQALEVLRLKEPLSDWLITAMLIEHLHHATSQGALGWILVNFPASFDQVRLFEASITGQWVPNPDKPNEDQGGRTSLVQSKIVCDPNSPVEADRPFCTVFTSVVAVSPTEPPPVVSLVNEVYLRQDVFACVHCVQFEESAIKDLAEMLLRASPHPPAEPIALQSESTVPDFNIPSDLKLGMVALWEALETAYLARLHRVALTRRTMQVCFARHLSSVKTRFGKFLGREDSIQTVLDLFAGRYKEVPRPWDEESKSEMVKRIEQLNETIYGQIETKRREASEEINEIAEKSILARLLIEKLQVAAAVAQLELDRFVDTVALLQDFSYASLEKIPPNASKSVRYEVPKVIGAEVGDEWTNLVAKTLIADEFPDEWMPEEFADYLSSVVDSARTNVEKLTGSQKIEIDKMEKEFQPKPQKGKGAKDKGAKAKKGKGPTVDDVPSLADLEAERFAAKRIFFLQEWRSMVENEAELTINAIERETERQKEEAETLARKLWGSAFQIMRTAADLQKSSESDSLRELKEFLDTVVEAEAEIKDTILFPRKTRYLSYLQRPDAPAPVTRPRNFYQELHDLVKVLKRLAPDGRILLSGLVYLLHQSASAGKHLPQNWRELDKEGIHEVLKDFLNGDTIVDWRSLVVALLELPIASQQQLLLALQKLRLGTRKKFVESKIWMDTMFADEDEAAEAKNLIFDVYCPKDDDNSSVLEFLSAAVFDTCPVAAFMKTCSLHQEQVLEEEKEKLDEMPHSDVVLLESAVTACQAVFPTKDEAVGPRLQKIWNEVEDTGLTNEQRRARNRAVAAGTYKAEDATQAPVDLLKENQSLQQLASEYFRSERLEKIIRGKLRHSL